MGTDNVRDDFLTGNNGAKKLTEEDLQKLDDLFVEVSPKHDIEEGVPPFSVSCNIIMYYFTLIMYLFTRKCVIVNFDCTIYIVK